MVLTERAADDAEEGENLTEGAAGAGGAEHGQRPLEHVGCVVQPSERSVGRAHVGQDQAFLDRLRALAIVLQPELVLRQRIVVAPHAVERFAEGLERCGHPGEVFEPGEDLQRPAPGRQ